MPPSQRNPNQAGPSGRFGNLVKQKKKKRRENGGGGKGTVPNVKKTNDVIMFEMGDQLEQKEKKKKRLRLSTVTMPEKGWKKVGS